MGIKPRTSTSPDRSTVGGSDGAQAVTRRQSRGMAKRSAAISPQPTRARALRRQSCLPVRSMSCDASSHRSAYTLIEVVLVAGLLVLISAMTVPRLVHLLERESLPGSARQLRSLITLVRAHAAWDGLRYRIRFPEDKEKDLTGDTRQPIIEREAEPIEFPEEFVEVTESWAIGATLLDNAWVAEVRLGRPTIADLQRIRQYRSEIKDALEEEFEDVEHLEAERPPLIIEADGTSEWAVFVVTQAPRETDIKALEEFARIELIVDGMTGLAWMQRPFYDQELDLFEEKGWPAILRQDFLTKRELTENDVLELHEFRIQPDEAVGSDSEQPPPGFESTDANHAKATP